MAEGRRFDGATLTDVTPSLVGIARAYPEVVRGAVVPPPPRVIEAPPAVAPLVLPSWGRREITDPEPIDLPFQFAVDEVDLDPVRAIERARCPLGRLEVAHISPAVCGSDAERIERPASAAELDCIREALDRARVGTESSWQFCQLGRLRTYEGWKAEYYDELFRWLRELGCPPLACETIRWIAEATAVVRPFTGCPQDVAITYRLRLGSASARLDALSPALRIVECRARRSLPRPGGPDEDRFVVERPPIAEASLHVAELALEGFPGTRFFYPRGCRVTGAYLPAQSAVVIVSLGAPAEGQRLLQLHRLGVRPGTTSYGRLLGPSELVALGAGPGPSDIFGRDGLRAHQSTVVPRLARPALFAVVDSAPGGAEAQHYVVEASADPSVPAAMLEVRGLTHPAPAPAGIAYGELSTAGEARLAFAYARTAGRDSIIEFGFLERAADHWAFLPTAEVACPRTVEDNVAVVYSPITAGWTVAFVPSNYEPGAFVHRFDFRGRPLSRAPTVVVNGSGDNVVGPHSGLTLALNRRTGRFLLAVSHNVAPFEPASDGGVRITANDGHVTGPGDHEVFNRLPARGLFSHDAVWTVAPTYVEGLEFRGGGPVTGDPAPAPTICGVCSPPGPGFQYRRGPVLWPGGRGYGFVHAYVELSDLNRFLALIAHESLPDAGGQLYATFIQDGAIPPR